MAEPEKKLPVKKEATSSGLLEWHPFETLRRQIDKLFEDFPFGRRLPDFEPFERFTTGWMGAPAVDLIEKNKEYEMTAELPGLDDKNVEVKLSNGALTISGEKKEEREEKEKGYYLSERRYGSFRRSFPVPEGVDADKIEASFDKGILTVRLPKTPEAQKAEKKIAIKTK
jgi:HSP20 family protein